MKSIHFTIIFITLILALQGCSSVDHGTPTPITPAVAALNTSIPTSSPTAANTQTPKPPLPPSATPSSTSIPPTNTPLPTATPIILQYDDFSDPSSGWENYSESDGFLGYYESGYRMYIPVEQNTYWVNYGEDFNDIRIEVEAARLDGPEANLYGLMCRLDHTTYRYYAFVITSQGEYAILKRDNFSVEYLGSDGLQFSQAIHTGIETNLIRADCIGNTLRLYVNNLLLLETMDEELKVGDVGLVAGTSGIAGTDIFFDNLTLIQP
ncbi:MAG: hypothetical protein JW726_06345 [Anaerolineales bacterium]|nr:hypothetical protein [Anaerolineales bacterium]